MLSTLAVTPEQVGLGSGRSGKDRRGRQPGRPRQGPGWGRPGLRRGATVSPSLRPPAAVAAAQLQITEWPQLRAERWRRRSSGHPQVLWCPPLAESGALGRAGRLSELGAALVP